MVALRRAAEYDEMRRKPQGKIPVFKDIRKAKAHEIIDNAIKNSQTREVWLSPHDIQKLLSCYGIKYAEIIAAGTVAEAQETAARLGFPVAVKLDSLTITHKTDVGGVVLNVGSKVEVQQAFNT